MEPLCFITKQDLDLTINVIKAWDGDIKTTGTHDQMEQLIKA